MQCHAVQLRKALAREVHLSGVSCDHCESALHHEHMPPFTGVGTWGYDFVPWLSARVCAMRARGVCHYHRLLNRVRARGHREIIAKQGRDLVLKRQLHTTLFRERGGGCNACGRRPDDEHPDIGFDFNHLVCRRDGGDKAYNISDFWISWDELHGNSKSHEASTRNQAALHMPYADAEAIMRTEAMKCEVLCRSCHARVTDDQHAISYDWRLLEAWVVARVIPAVVRELAGGAPRLPPVLHISI